MKEVLQGRGISKKILFSAVKLERHLCHCTWIIWTLNHVSFPIKYINVSYLQCTVVLEIFSLKTEKNPPVLFIYPLILSRSLLKSMLNYFYFIFSQIKLWKEKKNKNRLKRMRMRAVLVLVRKNIEQGQRKETIPCAWDLILDFNSSEESHK